MVLHLIGLGLGDENDITVKGLERVRQCKYVFLEAYTSILGVSKEKLEQFYGKEIIEADRELVEQGCEDEILGRAKDDDVALLVVGDPFGATTHSDMVVRARQMGITVRVVHNASIMNAVACCGLQLYRFGQTVSIVFFSETWRPDSFYDKILANTKMGLHTLCLLDIKVKEQSEENMARGRKIFEPPRFMTVNQCIEQLIEVEEKRKGGAYDPDKTMCVGLARVGLDDQVICAGTMKQLADVDFGSPLHSFVICSADLHEMEWEELSYFHANKDTTTTTATSLQEQ